MRHAKQGTAYPGRRRSARPKNNNGRLLGSKDWQDRKIITKFRGRIEDSAGMATRLGDCEAKGDVEQPSSLSNLHTTPWPSMIRIYRFGARLVSFSIRLLGAAQWISSSSICAAAPMPRTSLRSCEER